MLTLHKLIALAVCASAVAMASTAEASDATPVRRLRGEVAAAETTENTNWAGFNFGELRSGSDAAGGTHLSLGSFDGSRPSGSPPDGSFSGRPHIGSFDGSRPSGSFPGGSFSGRPHIGSFDGSRPSGSPPDGSLGGHPPLGSSDGSRPNIPPPLVGFAGARPPFGSFDGSRPSGSPPDGSFTGSLPAGLPARGSFDGSRPSGYPPQGGPGSYVGSHSKDGSSST